SAVGRERVRPSIEGGEREVRRLERREARRARAGGGAEDRDRFRGIDGEWTVEQAGERREVDAVAVDERVALPDRDARVVAAEPLWLQLPAEGACDRLRRDADRISADGG